MSKLITIYWRDIPAQVIGRAGRGSFKRELESRFQEAIDRAAMRAGRGSSDAYLEDWRRETESVDGDLESQVEERARALETQFTADLLERTVKRGGRLPEGADGG